MMMSAGNTPNIAIIGGGRMGCGIAFIFASSGHSVCISEPYEERRNQLPDAFSELCDLLCLDPRVLGEVKYVGEIKDAVSHADIVIEAAPENLELKKTIFRELEKWAPRDAILATNTSAIPISKIAQETQNPGRVVGAHFWNPPHLIELVEVILGEGSSEQAAKTLMSALSDVGMTPVLLKKDVPGFVGNRLQHALKREAIAIVAAGICDAETVDTVTKLGFGARLPVMGPLEQSDLLGLELTHAVHSTLMPDLDITPAPHPYLVQRIEDGKIGASVGEGFRKWTQIEADEQREKMDTYLVQAARKRYKARSAKK